MNESNEPSNEELLEIQQELLNLIGDDLETLPPKDFSQEEFEEALQDVFAEISKEAILPEEYDEELEEILMDLTRDKLKGIFENEDITFDEGEEEFYIVDEESEIQAYILDRQEAFAEELQLRLLETNLTDSEGLLELTESLWNVIDTLDGIGGTIQPTKENIQFYKALISRQDAFTKAIQDMIAKLFEEGDFDKKIMNRYSKVIKLSVDIFDRIGGIIIEYFTEFET